MQHLKLMVPKARKTGETATITAPFDLSPIATADLASSEIVDQALTTAHDLYRDRSRWLAVHERLTILERTAEIMSERIEELTFEAAREGGKPYIDSKVEVVRAIDGIKLCIETMRTEGGEVIPMGINPASHGKLAFTHHEPIGVVVAVSAFNHPLNLIVHQVAPAVATGCPVIVKPAEDTPVSCYKFVEILREAGLPDEWCQMVVVGDVSISSQLVTDPRVGFFSFIGSARVGWMLRSRLAPGTRCALEHGGAAPVIFAKDADVDKALAKLVKGGFYHAGQVCVSVQRVYAHESIAKLLAEKIAASAKTLTIGDPTKEDTDIGPLIRPNEVKRVNEWVQEAVSDGAELLCGGEAISDTCYPCTVLYNPGENTRVSQKEIFGPVICVYSFSDIDEAIHRANQLPFSFQAAVFTREIDTAMHAYKNLDASAVMVNEHTAFRVDWMPFAGLRESGLGVGGIPHTIKDMQINKMVVFES